jgi:hypothetical protein
MKAGKELRTNFATRGSEVERENNPWRNAVTLSDEPEDVPEFISGTSFLFPDWHLSCSRVRRGS